MQFMDARVLIHKSTFDYNHATLKTKNIFVGFSDIYIIGSQFRNKLTQESQASAIYGTFIFVILDVNIYIQSTSFMGGLAYQGGAIYVTGTSKVMMNKTEFYNNKALLQGGAVFGSGFSDMSIVGSNIFRNNIALDTGDDFYVVNTEKRFLIKDANFWSP